MCIFDCALCPFKFAGVQAEGAVAPPLEEDKGHGFKAPKQPKLEGNLMDETVWLADTINAEQHLRPREFECTKCYNPVFTGFTVCLSCGHKVVYESVEMEVASPESSAAEGERLDPMAPEAISKRCNELSQRRRNAADKVAKFGAYTGIKSAFAPVKKVLNAMRSHRRKWDAGGWQTMGTQCMCREFARPHLLGSWQPTGPADVPPPELLPPLDMGIRHKLMLMQYIDDHADDFPEPARGNDEWPERHVREMESMAEDWAQAVKEATGEAIRAPQKRAEALREVGKIIGKEDQTTSELNRILIASAQLTTELGREPSGEEVERRTALLRVKERQEWDAKCHTWQHKKTYGAETQSDPRSQGKYHHWDEPSASDNQQGNPCGARAAQYGGSTSSGTGRRDDRSWRHDWSQSNRGSSSSWNYHDQDREAQSRHRDYSTWGDGADSYDNTVGRWRERLPEGWGQRWASWVQKNWDRDAQGRY